MEEKEVINLNKKKMKEERNLLLIIDPNNDFVDSEGSLFIPGAERCIKSLSKFIIDSSDEVSDIWIFQDSHYSYHIGHSMYWNEMPEPGTIITSQDIKDGKYTPLRADKDAVLEYLEGLERLGREHRIWPEHCIIGSKGWAFPDTLVEALNIWTLKGPKDREGYSVIGKGMNPDKEMHSAFSYMDGDINGQEETLLHIMEGYDKVYFSGFAKDICAAFSVVDIMTNPKLSGKLVFLDSCMASLDPKSPNLDVYEEAIKNFGAKRV